MRIAASSSTTRTFPPISPIGRASHCAHRTDTPAGRIVEKVSAGRRKCTIGHASRAVGRLAVLRTDKTPRVTELDQLVGGQHADPHSLLGAHPQNGGVLVRA